MRRLLLGIILMLSVSSVVIHAYAATIRIASAGLSGELLPLWIAQDQV